MFEIWASFHCQICYITKQFFEHTSDWDGLESPLVLLIHIRPFARETTVNRISIFEPCMVTLWKYNFFESFFKNGTQFI